MSISMLLSAGRKLDRRRLNVGNYYGRDHTSYVCEKATETSAEGLRAEGDSEGDKDDEHGVFGGGGAALVPMEAIAQTEHLMSPPEVENAVLLRSSQLPFDQSPSLTMFHQCRVQSGVRKS